MPPVILFGAWDRHNFGDLLFAHIAQALLPGCETLIAGLAARDMRRHGGHEVRAIAQIARERAGQGAVLLHAGGEILTCSAWQAAVMLQPPGQLQPAIAYLERHPNERAAWVRETLGTADLAPYVAPRVAAAAVSRVVYTGIGGVDLMRCEPALRDEVLAKLEAARGHAVGVRDAVTHACLNDAGIDARLMPDPVAMVAELFGPRLGTHAAQGEVARVRACFPQGHLAVQFSADFGDSDTLGRLAAQLDQAAVHAGCGVALFCAGLAPWHDDPALLRQLAARMRKPVTVVASDDAWDLCALIASARAYAGSSLHGRIVAMACGVPRVNLAPACGASKQAAYAATWDTPAMPGTVEPHELAQALSRALDTDTALLHRLATRTARRYRLAFEAMRASWQ